MPNTNQISIPEEKEEEDKEENEVSIPPTQALNLAHRLEHESDEFKTSSEVRNQLTNQITYREIALKTSLETVIVFGFAIASYPVLQKNTPWYYNPITLAGLLSFSNLMMRIGERYLKLKNPRSSTLLLAKMRPIWFALFDQITRATLLHESGHALADYLFFKNAHPDITLIPFNGGYSRCEDCFDVSDFGNWVGRKNRIALTFAAGAMAEMIWNYATMITAEFIPESYPELKFYLRLIVVETLIQLCAYALRCEFGLYDGIGIGDFTVLGLLGFPPLAAISVMLGSSLLLQTLLFCCKRLCNKPAIEEQLTVPEEKEEGVELPRLRQVPSRYSIFHYGAVDDSKTETPLPSAHL